MTETGQLLGWAICANISDHLRGGIDPEKFYQGTRMFSPGTRVYLGEAYWGMAADNLHVVGLRRISREWVNCVIEMGVLDNQRVTTVYSTSLWARLERLNAQRFSSKDEAIAALGALQSARPYNLPEKIKPEFRPGPWGPVPRVRYREGAD